MKFGAALLTAALLILAFPHFNFAFLAPVALAPLLWAAAKEPRHWRRFLLGWAAGVVYWAGACYWIQIVLHDHAGIAAWASWLGFVIFSLLKGLHLGVFALAAGLLMNRRFAVLTAPALWVAVEWSHTWLGFAWLDLGNAGINMPVPMRLAPFTGVYGLSFVFGATATALALVALRRPRIELAPAVALLVVWLLPALPAVKRGTESAVLVQPNIPEDAEWTQPWVDDMHQRLAALSLKGALGSPGADPALIVWPEAPAPMYYDRDPQFRGMVDQVARTTRSYVLLNVVPLAGRSPLNSALLVSPEGQSVGRYDQINLVPFGEYVPAPFKALIGKIATESDDFVPGARQAVLSAGPHKIGAFICYESVFPGFVRNLANQGAELLVNISNDGWYGASAAREQHLQIVRMRAAENRRWILRATNDGVTSTIDPGGRVARNLPSFTAASALTGFSWVGSTTFYSRHGDWFVWLCIIVALAALGAAILTPRYTKNR
jgi:apolipoprotein N-acyltransferase